jgi:hypothetical protein
MYRYKFQLGFLDFYGIRVLIVIVIVCFLLLYLNISVNFDADPEQISKVNSIVEKVKNEPFAEEFLEQTQSYFEDGRISKKEADLIIKKYETLKLQQNIGISKKD